MSVRTRTVSSGTGYTVGSVNDGQKRFEGVDFLRVAFDAFDVDKSGFLDPQEIRCALTMLGVRSSAEKGRNALSDMGIDDADGDGVVSLQDLDCDGDEKVSFEEFKVFASLLPKRDHPIYRNALAQKKVTLPRDTSKATAVQLDQHKAQSELDSTLQKALYKLRTKLKLTQDSKLRKDTVLLNKYNELDVSGDGRVDSKELINFLRDESGEDIAKSEAWVLMNCADTNNDKFMTFDEFKRMMQTVALAQAPQ